MATRTTPRGRRPEALSKERIVRAAIEILDAEGENALTFRALTARLATGAGAIYWHVANQDELLAAAAESILARALKGVVRDADPVSAIRGIGLGAFDAIDAHPWIGAQLAREPWQPAVLHILEAVGQQLSSLALTERQRFDYASALVNFVLGLAGQHAAGARFIAREQSRTDFLAGVALRWQQLGAGEYPFLQRFVNYLPDHDDREQFLAGIDVFLDGIRRQA